METVAETFQGQLDQSSEELQTAEAELDQADLSAGDRSRMTSMATEIRTHILEVEFDIVLANATVDVGKMERIGREIVSIFNDVAELRLHIILETLE